jgi:cytochrome P450
MNNGKVHYHHFKEDNTRFEGCDMRAKLMGITPLIQILSHKALREFVSFQPVKIDRVINIAGFAKMAYKGFAFHTSTNAIQERRKGLTKLLGLNNASRYIDVMVRVSESTFKQICEEDEIDIMYKMNVLTFMVFTNILFGKDVEAMVEQKRPYINKDGSVEQLKLRDIFLNLTKSYIEELFHPVTNMFPFVSDYNLISVYKINKQNNDTFKDACKQLIMASGDTSSLASRMADQVENISEEQIVDDLITLMIAGSETISHSVVAALFFVQKYPKVHDSLVNELKENGFMDIGNPNLFKEKYNMETLNEMPYLNSFVKETLRYDSVAAESFENIAKEDIEICGVPIKKGQIIVVEIHAAHFNEESWLDPLKFEPDRYNPDSEFYQEAKKQGIIHDPYSTRAFSHGLRNCPGQTFANLELKTVIAFMVSQGQFKFDQKDIDHEGIGFGLGSQFEPIVQVSKRAF